MRAVFSATLNIGLLSQQFPTCRKQVYASVFSVAFFMITRFSEIYKWNLEFPGHLLGDL